MRQPKRMRLTVECVTDAPLDVVRDHTAWMRIDLEREHGLKPPYHVSVLDVEATVVSDPSDVGIADP